MDSASARGLASASGQLRCTPAIHPIVLCGRDQPRVEERFLLNRTWIRLRRGGCRWRAAACRLSACRLRFCHPTEQFNQACRRRPCRHPAAPASGPANGAGSRIGDPCFDRRSGVTEKNSGTWVFSPHLVIYIHDSRFEPILEYWGRTSVVAVRKLTRYSRVTRVISRG
jgi:hypothetical protein